MGVNFIKLQYEIKNTKVIAKIEDCDILLKEEEILDYFRLLDLREYLQTLSSPDDITQIEDIIQRLEKRIGFK